MHTYARAYINHARSCTETGNGINHLLQPINRTFRYPEPMWRDAFPPISSKSHLIRAICACRAVRDCADRKLHRGAFLAFVREERDAAANPTRAFPSDSHQLEPSFPHAAPFAGGLVPMREPLSHILDGTRQIFATRSARTRFAIVLHSDTSRSAEHVNFVRRSLFRKRFLSPLLSRNFWINKGWLSRHRRSNTGSLFFLYLPEAPL